MFIVVAGSAILFQEGFEKQDACDETSDMGPEGDAGAGVGCQGEGTAP